MNRGRRLEVLEAHMEAEKAIWAAAQTALMKRALEQFSPSQIADLMALSDFVCSPDTEAAKSYFKALEGWQNPETWPPELLEWSEQRMNLDYFQHLAPPPAETREKWTVFLQRAAGYALEARAAAPVGEEARAEALKILATYHRFLAALLEVDSRNAG